MLLNEKARSICGNSMCDDACKLKRPCIEQLGDTEAIWAERMNKAADELEDL